MARWRMIVRIAEHVEHHHAVGHGGENRAEPVFAVEPLAHPGHRAVEGALARALWESNGSVARKTLSTPRKNQNHDAFCCGAFGAGPMVCGGSRNSSSMRTPFGVARPRLLRHQHQQRHDDGAAPIRDLVEMERKPFRQQHDLDRHHRHRAPGNEAEQSEHDAGEDIGARSAAAGQHRLAGAAHVIGVDRHSPIIFSAK